MIDWPCSWNSFEVIQSDLNESKEVKMDPPIQAENFLSWGAFTLISMVEGAKALISLNKRLLSPSVSSDRALPLNMVDPPASRIPPYKSFLICWSQLMMLWYIASWMPIDSLFILFGWNRASGHLKISPWSSISVPSGRTPPTSFFPDSKYSVI